ncbi:Uncharacterised protein [Bacteroides xylanisolvens]|nr:Uncharacterised protein [Bacteroides xylanisolvens]
MLPKKLLVFFFGFKFLFTLLYHLLIDRAFFVYYFVVHILIPF